MKDDLTKEKELVEDFEEYLDKSIKSPVKEFIESLYNDKELEDE